MKTTKHYDKAVSSLDANTLRKVKRLLDCLKNGQPIKYSPVGVERWGMKNVYELKIDKYRVYFTYKDSSIYLLFVGDKDSQQRDIERLKGLVV